MRRMLEAEEKKLRLEEEEIRKRRENQIELLEAENKRVI